MFRKNMQVIKENECMIKRYVYELDVLKQKQVKQRKQIERRLVN